MKHLFLPAAMLLCYFVPVQAQDCKSAFETLKTGVVLEYSMYDDKDKLSTVMTQTVKSVRTDEDTLIAVFDAVGKDDKGKEMYVSTFPVKCHQGTMYFDLRSMVPGIPKSSADSPDMQFEITGDALLYPYDMKPGQTLPDGSIEMKAMMNGMKLFNSRYFMKNRKVESSEAITTPAGTFQCVKLSYDTEYKFMGSRTTHNEIWFSERVGTVKSVSYGKKGKVESTMVLTKLTK